jgi:hypothetical protein
MLLVTGLPIAVQAQIADSQGNYYSNLVPSQLQAGSLWRVEAEALNCRRSPSLQGSVMRTYLRDAVLEVEVYRGGSDEVLVNPLDENRNPWMPVRGKSFSDVCFVRANSRFIQPK